MTMERAIAFAGSTRRRSRRCLGLLRLPGMRRRDVNPEVFPQGADPLSPQSTLNPRSVLALIVTYHPDAGVGDHMRPLIGTVGAILFVDNGSHPDEIAPLELFARGCGADLLKNERNVGLATALNQGFRWAADRGFGWVLTLDQDTEPTSAVVPEAAKVLAAHANRRIAVVGAGYGYRTVASSSPSGSEVACAITAGALQSVRAWQHLGGFRDDFFIDYVDTEFCLRARAEGYAVFKAGRPTIRHAIGNPVTHDVGFRTFRPSNHTHQRRYYITRNRVAVWRTFARREPKYVAYDVRASAKELVKLILFEGDRRRKLRAVLRGSLDGLRGVTGESGAGWPRQGTRSTGGRGQ